MIYVHVEAVRNIRIVMDKVYNPIRQHEKRKRPRKGRFRFLYKSKKTQNPLSLTIHLLP
mgnify:FL=1